MVAMRNQWFRAFFLNKNAPMGIMGAFCKAERVGFEPTIPRGDTRSPGARTRPDYATSPRVCDWKAEREGFEPSRAVNPTRFRDARTRPDYATSP